MVNVKDEKEDLDFGPYSSDDGDNIPRSANNDTAPADTAATSPIPAAPTTSEDARDPDPADTAATQAVVASPVGEKELTVSELQECLAIHKGARDDDPQKKCDTGVCVLGQTPTQFVRRSLLLLVCGLLERARHE